MIFYVSGCFYVKWVCHSVCLLGFPKDTCGIQLCGIRTSGKKHVWVKIPKIQQNLQTCQEVLSGFNEIIIIHMQYLCRQRLCKVVKISMWKCGNMVHIISDHNETIRENYELLSKKQMNTNFPKHPTMKILLIPEIMQVLIGLIGSLSQVL